MGSIPRSGRSLGERNGNPLQYPWLGNAMDRGAWRAAVRGVTESQTWLSDPHDNSIFRIQEGSVFSQPPYKQRLKWGFLFKWFFEELFSLEGEWREQGKAGGESSQAGLWSQLETSFSLIPEGKIADKGHGEDRPTWRPGARVLLRWLSWGVLGWSGRGVWPTGPAS